MQADVDVLAELRGELRRALHQVEAQLHPRERVSDLVRDPGRDASERGEPLLVRERVGQLALALMRLAETRRHASESAGDPRELEGARRIDGRREVAAECVERLVERSGSAFEGKHGVQGEEDEGNGGESEGAARELPRVGQSLARANRGGGPRADVAGAGDSDDQRLAANALARVRDLAARGFARLDDRDAVVLRNRQRARALATTSGAERNERWTAYAAVHAPSSGERGRDRALDVLLRFVRIARRFRGLDGDRLGDVVDRRLRRIHPRRVAARYEPCDRDARSGQHCAGEDDDEEEAAANRHVIRESWCRRSGA